MYWLNPEFPFRPRKIPFFYGWVILAVSTFGILMSIPGQTMGVSIFTDHLLRATGLSRMALSQAYLVGTLASGLLLPLGGSLLDRVGARLMGILSAGLLAATLCVLAVCDRLSRLVASLFPDLDPRLGAWMVLVVGFTALRFSGQGMLTLTSRTMLGKWFDTRRGQVSGIAGVVVSLGFGLAPLLLSAWVAAAGWRQAWRGMALAVALGMGLLGWLFFRDNPEECGLPMDGVRVRATRGSSEDDSSRPQFTRSQALGTLAFWIVALALSTQSLAITSITFHIVDLGGAAGLGETAAVGVFLPMALISMGVGFPVGLLCDSVRIQTLVIVMMFAEVLGFVGFADFGAETMRGLGVFGFGVGSGFFGPLSVAALPHFFGRRHLGAISGAQMVCLVFASALGPAALAVSRQYFGSYAPGLYALCVLPALVALMALLAHGPRLQASSSKRAD